MHLTNLRTTSLLIVLLLLFPGLPAAQKRRQRRTITQAELTPKEIARKAIPATVEIATENRDNSQTGGTGFFVESGLIATCFHVIGQAKRITIRPMRAGSEWIPARVTASNEFWDLALLEPEGYRSSAVLSIFKEGTIGVGDEVYSATNPLGQGSTFVNGLVSSLIRTRYTTGPVLSIQHTAPTSPGSSGSALLNKRGEIIGVIDAKARGGELLNYAVSFWHLETLMKGETSLPPEAFEFSNYGDPKP